MKLLVLTCAVAALLLVAEPVSAEEMVEQTTESPIADMALVDQNTDDVKAEDVMSDEAVTSNKENVEKILADSQSHTIADFIIHPLIALKPRVPETENGRQAVSSSTPSPWQLFGFNAGQGLGSSVSSLAGSVTGWLGNRIQLPSLVETPVRESSTSTTSTTTPRPDVVVRIKQRASTRKPLISINNSNNHNNRPSRRNKRPNRYNNNIDDSEEEDDSGEYEEQQNVNRNRKRYQYNNDEESDDKETSNENEEEEEEEDENVDDNVNNRYDDDEEEEEQEEDQRPVKPQNNKRRRHPKPLNHNNNNRRRNTNNNNQRKSLNNNQRKRFQQRKQDESDEEDQYEDDDEDQLIYYHKNQGSKRSQTEQNLIQRGQQTLLKQIRQFTRGQTPAEVGNSLRKSQKSTKKTRGQQATLIVNRNGQTIYVAPELLQVADDINSEDSTPQNVAPTRRPISNYPQPPLTTPYRRKGQPVQYITIPWNQLGISPPDQIVSLTNGIQSQHLILNIPQSAIDNMQSLRPNKKKQMITADAVPLLAEASIMDVFKPPRIPPARTPIATKPTKPTKKVSTKGTPVVIATKTKNGPARIRPATVVEKAPAEDIINQDKNSDEDMDDDESETSQFIVIGDEAPETQLNRNSYRHILEYFNQRRVGRQLNTDEVAPLGTTNNKEQLIPVQIIQEQEEPAKLQSAVADKLDMATEQSLMTTPEPEHEKDKTETLLESSKTM